MFKSIKTNIFATCSLIILIIVLRLCNYMFPWTGLAAIISVPFIYLLSIGTILLGIRITFKQKTLFSILIWLIISTINLLIAVNLYPQEFRPSVTKQIGFTYQVIKNYDEITLSDLELYKVSDFNRFDGWPRDSREKYVAALCKYQYIIPRNGSHLLYGKKDVPILKETNIKLNLETGQDRLIWWFLNKKLNNN